MKRILAGLFFVWIVCGMSNALAGEWDQILERAQGQTVYFNAWGGSQPINNYIQWASDTVQERFGITVIHVKTTDIAGVVSRILVEKSASKNKGGSVDLMWINGENFKTMKENNLLYGPFSGILPNYTLVDTENKKTVLYDFTVPVDHMESPWGMAQLVFMYDTAQISKHPETMKELLAFAEKNPGRFTYPGIPGFHGTTFIKQAMLELVQNPEILYQPVDMKDFEKQTQPLWNFLDRLHPLMWRKGKVFPESASKMLGLLNDNEIFISLSFNPNEAANAIENKELPESVRTYIHNGGTIGNSHFVAIPFNSSAKEGAMVFADFLLSPLAQAKKSDPKVWGDPTVLDINKLSPSQKALFSAIETPPATLDSESLGKVLPEPHVSWVDALEKAWLKRYHQ